ncbi:hypothetical protein [Curvivirga aplysinae]|uniref:hypothetical protein n=1 Tax=Curvivirga aplysinae TaxID=2529852 RepID=UPI0012BCE2ED|nr:hypothetical protein [Curvivirga aplysinae]MTI09121.1 hypothetical protein [Curvivirga aplysinae]
MYVSSNDNSLYSYLTQRNEVYRSTDEASKQKVQPVTEVVKSSSQTSQPQGNSYTVGNNDILNSSQQVNSTQKSQEAETLFNASQIGQEETSNIKPNASAVMETSHGKITVNLDEYFTPKTHNGPINIDDFPILMPNKSNMQAIRQHTEERLQQLLKANNIPESPSQISYDNQGQIQLPQDYPYKEEFMNALSSSPGLKNELNSLAAMASHFNAFQQIAKTGSASQFNEKITLDLDDEGNLVINANGKPLDFNQKTAAAGSETEDGADEDAEESNEASARNWFLDYMQKTPEERYFEDLLRELGMTPEEYAALSQEEKLEVDKKIEERMKKDVEENTTILS